METLGYLLIAWLIFAFGRWRGRRRSEALARRAYIAGVDFGIHTMIEQLREADAIEDSIPPSDEVQEEERKRA
jgi:hypothetical protein